MNTNLGDESVIAIDENSAVKLKKRRRSSASSTKGKGRDDAQGLVDLLTMISDGSQENEIENGKEVFKRGRTVEAKVGRILPIVAVAGTTEVTDSGTYICISCSEINGTAYKFAWC